MTELQKLTAQAIVCVFETGRPLGDYGAVTLLSGDSGGLTYGKAQTTRASGNLALLIADYCRAPGARYAGSIMAYQSRLDSEDPELDHDSTFRSLLADAGDDPVMQRCQDAFFDRVFWRPAVAASIKLGLSTALATAVVYDSCIHGSLWPMVERTRALVGDASTAGEHEWIRQYLVTRRAWLKAKSELLARTVYRCDAFRELIIGGKWGLELPILIRGQVIDEHVLAGESVRASAEHSRVLRLRHPPMTGEDVADVQRALGLAGLTVTVDGVYGQRTAALVLQYQQRQNQNAAAGLREDGVVGPATRAELGI